MCVFIYLREWRLSLEAPLISLPSPFNSKMSRSSRFVGSRRWDSYEDVPLNRCFESGSHDDEGARTSHNSEGLPDDSNDNSKDCNINVAVIVVSSRRITKGPSIEEAKKSCVWVRDYLELEEQESSDDQPNKPVDEDLYKIPPELLFSKPKKKTGLSLLSSCLLPACAF